ncbi:MAG: GNAT family N-acetyltransferase [Salibacteraceae bacterium]
MIKLLPFTSADFELFKSWMTTEEDMVQFAGTIFTWPVTDEQLRNYLAHPDLKPFKVVLKDSGKIVGHCEFNYQKGQHRLSRVLIANNTERGKGLGEQMIRKMAQTFFEDTSVSEVDLNVFAFNKAAIRCYEKVGFEINPTKSVQVPVNNETWLCLNMILKRERIT